MLLVKYSFNFTYNQVHIFPIVAESMYIFSLAPIVNWGGEGEKLT